MHAAGVPVALFYRDAYHRARGFLAVPPMRRALRRFMSYLASRDLKRYNEYVSCLYLPSLGMRAEIPEYVGATAALPPGATQLALPMPKLEADEPLRLLYVGGLGDMYQMHRMFQAVRDSPGVELTVCTRRADWEAVQEGYEAYACPQISVVHRSSEQLSDLYARAHVAVLAVAPNAYRDFAVPVKLFEYVGAGRPVVASTGTLAGRYVEENALGWSVEYDSAALTRWIADVIAKRSSVAEAAYGVRQHSQAVTWSARARTVADAWV